MPVPVSVLECLGLATGLVVELVVLGASFSGAGRTVLQSLTAAQAKAYARAIRENRRLERIVADMRATSFRLLELTTPGVVRRQRRTETKKALS